MATTSLVEWRSWGRAAFEEARAERVPVLLAIGARWCPATVAMMRGAYADPRVADLLDDRFVPVRVDAEARPDIAERYGLGGWPTTAFLTPDGDVLGGETYVTAERMRDLLPRVAEAFAAQREAIAGRGVASEPRPVVPPDEVPDPDVDAWLGEHLLAQFDEPHGGFGAGAKRVHAAALELASRRARAGDDAFAPLVERTIQAMAWGELYDHAEGGVFRYCARRDWTEPGTEKLLAVNAEALRLFLLLEDEGCREQAVGVIGYVRRTLLDTTPDCAGFFASQQGDPEYYRPRGDTGIANDAPPVDRAVYADGTARMARAFAAASEAFGDSSLLEYAVDAIEHVVAGTYERGGGIAHRAGDRSGVRGLLADQVGASAALLDLHDLTDRDVYLDMAQELMHFAIQRLWDTAGGGGFLDRVNAPDDVGLLREPVRPFAANCEAARLLLRLARIAGDAAFRERAVAALASQTPVVRAHGVDAAPYALAVRDLVELSQ